MSGLGLPFNICMDQAIQDGIRPTIGATIPSGGKPGRPFTSLITTDKCTVITIIIFTGRLIIAVITRIIIIMGSVLYHHTFGRVMAMGSIMNVKGLTAKIRNVGADTMLRRPMGRG